MRFTRTQFETPSQLVVSVAEVRAIIPADDVVDTELESHIKAAQARFETYTGYHLGERATTLECRRTAYDDRINPIIFDVAPVTEVTSVELRPLFTGDYTTTTLTSSDYYLDDFSLTISYDKLYRRFDLINIVCTTGYFDLTMVPEDIRRSLIEYVGSGHLEREGDTMLPANVKAVWSSYKVKRVG